MNRNQLRYFVAAAESRNFTKAAEQFYITQTAITQQIRQLEDTLVAALYSSHPLANRRQVRRSELRGETIIYMSPDSANDSYGDAFFMQLYKEAGYKPNILCRSSDAESVLIMVAAEEGISILPGYFTDKLYNADNLSFVPMVGEGEYEEIIASWRRDSVNPILEQFLESLRAACPLSEYN